MAEDTIADAAAITTGKIGPHYDKWDFWELNGLVKQSTYLGWDFRTEMDKIDQLMDRWRLYLDSSVNEQERNEENRFQYRYDRTITRDDQLKHIKAGSDSLQLPEGSRPKNL